MLKISDIPLKKKLVGSFLLVSLATVLIGLFGRYAASTIGTYLQKATDESIPAIENMATMRDLANQFVQAQRGLLNAYLNQETLEGEYTKVEAVRSEYAKSLKAFEAVPHSPEVEARWKEYLVAFGEWGSVNDTFFAKLKELEATGILNPLPVHADTLKAKGAFDSAITRMGGRIYSLEDKDDTDWGDIAVSLSAWGENHTLTNGVIEEELMTIEMEASLLERYLTQMDSLIERGFRSQAAGIYQQDLLSVQSSISDAFFKISSEVDKAVAINREMNALAMGPCREKRLATMALLGKVGEALDHETRQMVADGRGVYKKAQATNFIIMLVAVGLSLFFGVGISVAITKALEEGVAVSQGMARGDLTRTLEVNRADEIGVLGDSLNTVVQSLHAMMGRINDGVGRLSGSSIELSAVASQVKSGAVGTSERSDTVAAAAEEMNTGISFVASSVEEAAQNIASVASAAGQMAATIEEIGKNANTAKEITDSAVMGTKNATQKVGALGDSAEEIGTISETISGISQQINLLALNATIEAARAGDAGRGFAVVAGEIKDLAGETSSATEKIHTQVAAVQSQIESTISEIAQVSTVVGRMEEVISIIASAMEEQAIATNEIAGNVEIASAKVGDVSNQVGENSATVATIARDIAGVNASAREITGSTDVLTRCAGDMNQLADELKEMTSHFTL
ncbi:hypothetical protein DSLASN_30070 [Desulfoluna limicola]|uniref:Methyl-accepting chemotaxis protein n=1 Tax=Desulfoluna limicola TaxID=2810562 RepID=A0ABM7PIH9_9BACT|nr:methyl-accepting chemotaxis protein [Desulfoluna limicola]BCS97375.1 hypothetical protein DSLASN_30070 [Desulfoluna limicola]